MSDEVEKMAETPRRAPRPPLTLRRTEKAAVKQSFSHGRTKSVAVEIKRRRTPLKKEDETPAAEAPAKPVEAAPSAPVVAASRQGAVLPSLSEEEKTRRVAALHRAREEEDVRRRREEAERAEREAREAEDRARLEEDRKKQAEETARRAKEIEARRQAEAAAQEALEAEERERKKKSAAKSEGRVKSAAPETGAAVEADNPLARLGGRLKTRRKVVEEKVEDAKTRDAPRRRTGRLTIAKALDDDERQRSLASVRRAREREKVARQQRGDAGRVVREVVIPETITVQDLAQRMSMRAVDLVTELMRQGQMVTANAVIDADTAQLIVEDLGHVARRVAEGDIEEGLFGAPDAEADLRPRPPVVAVMGHVDHGKTSLLDALRKTDVASGEAGGITQHIGAYQVELPDGRKVTFLDTPGHAAFTQMRARGGKVADIVVLVVAADDSVMPQTAEAISHARAAGAPIIVAINKIDKPDADPKRVRTDLLQHEIQVESLGGDVQDVEVSALKKQNLDGLLEAILLQAEVLNLRANPDRPAEGAVIEASIDKGRGPVATLLVQRGALKRGDIVVAGGEWGKVRVLADDKGQQIAGAAPAQPVEALGLTGAPDPGDQFAVVESESRAREIAEFRRRKKRDRASAKKAKGVSLEQMMAHLQNAEIKELPIVVKADVQGSAEAISGALDKLSTDDVRVRILHSGVGAVSESDVILAAASDAPIIGFNVRANKDARDEAERTGVEIRYYSVIYDLIDDVKGVLTGMLEPELRETLLGNAEILEVFNISKVGKVAGCRVTDGVVRRGAKVRLLRDNTVIHEGELSQLKRFKDDAAEVQAGQECGMSFAKYEDLKQGDVIECFKVEKVMRTL